MGVLFNNGNKSQTVTVSSGTGSATFSNLDGLRLVHLFIHPTTSSTVWSWRYTDKNSLNISGDGGWTGDRDILDSKQLVEYTYGSFTITIFTSSADEDFTVLPVFSEET